jgi:hypothetical protein
LFCSFRAKIDNIMTYQRIQPNRIHAYWSSLCIAALLTLASCDKAPKDTTTSAGVDTSSMVADTSTQALRRQQQADSLDRAVRQQTDYLSKLQALSVTINRACPVSFTPTIYLDSSRVLGPGQIQFNMRLRNYVAGSSDIEPKKEETRKSLMTSITADQQPVVAQLRRNGVSIIFRYRDKTGQPLFDIPLSGEGK